MSGSDARQIIEEKLRRELFGPSGNEQPIGRPLDTNKKLVFQDPSECYGLFYDRDTGEEILTTEHPLQRYCAGVLHSSTGWDEHCQTIASYSSDLLKNCDQQIGSCEQDSSNSTDQQSIKFESEKLNELDADDFDLSDMNSFEPSAMGISFEASIVSDSELSVLVSGATYDPLPVSVGESSRTWWCRRPFQIKVTLCGTELLSERPVSVPLDKQGVIGRSKHLPQIQVYSRAVPGETDACLRLITVVVINRATRSNQDDNLFQIGFSVIPLKSLEILPYPLIGSAPSDDEGQTIELLYRKKRTYAIGHGCSAEWEVGDSGYPSKINAVAIPVYEVPSLTPNIFLTDADGNFILDERGNRKTLSISMAGLAAWSSDSLNQIENLLEKYSDWIGERDAEVERLDSRYRSVAIRHIGYAKDALERMRFGWSLINSDASVKQVFIWMNQAMLQQQVRSSLPLRTVSFAEGGRIEFESPHPKFEIKKGRGEWRPFQIAFILACLPEIVNSELPSRELVDLIFFPTGGGKTEAYLGVSAISMLSRRLANPDDSGTDVLMRYTLRVLTAQQFLRAAALVCSLEELRQSELEKLGSKPFSIGIWLGLATTPNTWKQASKALSELENKSGAKNPFLLLRCPWCAAQMGPVPNAQGKVSAVGYRAEARRKEKIVRFRCPDSECPFSKKPGLPIHVVDEDIYESCPSMLIGTVDKFAMLAFVPEARAIFGISEDGERRYLPPNLIIQDELHLISGPLGSMVGLYEPVINELCTDRSSGNAVPPKIIASTATARHYGEQVKCLFGRDQVAVFPPYGLEEGHSFFAEPAISLDGAPEPGRRYLGVMSSTGQSMQSLQTRVAAVTLRAIDAVAPTDRDGYWTNLNFFNSLRELGNTVSLLQFNVPDYLKRMDMRDGNRSRFIRRRMELTSRIRSDKIPDAIVDLERKYRPDVDIGGQDAIDICLASSIIEVGVDIDRLALMTIVGQPKTTAQYIQVSGRVGRRPEVSPGLVITLLSASKPRERSHYERFVTFHERLYSQIEPTSVTPFALPVLQRALHASIIAYIRQTASENQVPFPIPEQRYQEALEFILTRARIADPDVEKDIRMVAERRFEEWNEWKPINWERKAEGVGYLLRRAGSDSEDGQPYGWNTPMSMRNVDAECQLKISAFHYSMNEASDE